MTEAECVYVFMCVSQQKSAYFVWTRFPVNECVHQIPRLTPNPEHRLIPQCNASGLNVKKMIIRIRCDSWRNSFLIKDYCVTFVRLVQPTVQGRGKRWAREQHRMAGLGININFPLLYINIRPQLNPHALLKSIKPIQTHIPHTVNHPCFIWQQLEYSLDKNLFSPIDGLWAKGISVDIWVKIHWIQRIQLHELCNFSNPSINQ